MSKPTPSRLSARDAISEAVAGLLQRPARSALTTVGTVLGVGTFVAILGLTATAAQQISGRFDSLTATQITVTDGRAAGGDASAGNPFPDDAETIASSLHGVHAAGVTWTLANPGDVSRSPVPGEDAQSQVSVIAATPGLFTAVNAHVLEGRTFDRWARTTRAQVAVLGSAAAVQLGVTSVASRPAVFIGGRPFTVVGIIDSTTARSDLLLSVILPDTTVTKAWGQPTSAEQASMLVVTAVGAAQQVAGELNVAMRPDDSTALAVQSPPDPQSLRTSVSTDLAGLFFALASICLVIGAVGIANTTLVAVMERVPEIGLRRAIGARRRHIGVQFLIESAALGGLGGLIGASLGIMAVIIVCVTQQWTPVVDPNTLIAAPLIGLLSGLAAGLYPAVRAARIEPSVALRR